VHGSRVVAAVLSGSGDDGTAGLQLVKAHGGIALVQDPQDAVFPDMPRNAARHVPIDATATAAELGPLLVRICRDGLVARVDASPGAAIDESGERLRIALDKAEQQLGERVDSPSVLSCPDCGGVLWELKEGQLVRYRCHVGHSYSPDRLEEDKAHALETALWTAVRMFRERAMLSRRGATRAVEQGMRMVVANLHHRAEDAERCATLIENLLGQEHVGGQASMEDPDTD
jgi:two-component system, chemotaxis family, protein-glutamate methylesterase/glutaminase